MQRIAIIGAGLAGLALANKLKGKVHSTVFEKSRGPGGRLATRYIDGHVFDHGAPFFTAKKGEFHDAITKMMEANVIAPWQGRFVELSANGIANTQQWDDKHCHYVGIEGMKAIGYYLANDLSIVYHTRITSLQRQEDRWHLVDEQAHQHGPFDWVLMAIPSHQALELLPHDFYAYQTIKSVKMLPCCALMLGFNRPVDPGFQAGLFKDADISWLSINHSKPQRKPRGSWTLLSTNAWANDHIDDKETDITQHMIGQLQRFIDVPIDDIIIQRLQRWRYANIKKHQQGPAFLDSSLRLGCCGDWCVQGRVSWAFASAMSLYDMLGEAIED